VDEKSRLSRKVTVWLRHCAETSACPLPCTREQNPLQCRGAGSHAAGAQLPVGWGLVPKVIGFQTLSATMGIVTGLWRCLR